MVHRKTAMDHWKSIGDDATDLGVLDEQAAVDAESH